MAVNVIGLSYPPFLTRRSRENAVGSKKEPRALSQGLKIQDCAEIPEPPDPVWGDHSA